MAEAGQPEQAETDLGRVCRELAILCRRSRSRTLGWPRDWRPGSVVNPKDEDGQVFTEVGAWEFVADLLEAGHSVQVVDLARPPGKKGYVLLAPGGEGRPEIYVKLQLGTGQVLGRSFHYSERANGRTRT